MTVLLALKNIVRLSNGQATKPFPNKVTYPLLTTVNLFSLHGLMVGKSNPRGTLVWAPSLCAVPAVVPVGATWGAESQGPAQCVRRVQTRHVCSVCVKINLSHQHIFVTSTLFKNQMVYSHATWSKPEPIRSQKLSRVRPD